MQTSIDTLAIILVTFSVLTLITICVICNLVLRAIGAVRAHLAQIQRLSESGPMRPPSGTHLVRIEPDGEVKFLYDDKLAATLKPEKGEMSIRRASHIETGADLSYRATEWLVKNSRPAYPAYWYADLFPAGIERVLGPFPTYAQARGAEVEFLVANGLQIKRQPSPTELTH